MNPSIPTALLAATITMLFSLSALAAEPAVVVEDRERIQDHLAQVEAELRERDVSHLSDELREERRKNLDVLREYRKAGEFPRNTHVPRRQPVFIDREDRACAVGYLMIRSGWDDAARAISERENLAYLPQMESPEVEQWVAQSGLTAEEAAKIQPTYSPCMNCSCGENPVCGVDGNTYINRCAAETCAGVTVLHPGCCHDGAEINHDIENHDYMCGYSYPDDESHLCHLTQGGDDVGHGDDDAGHQEADAGHGEDDAGHGEDDAGQSGGDAGHPPHDDSTPDPDQAACATAATGPGGAGIAAFVLLALIGLRRTIS